MPTQKYVIGTGYVKKSKLPIPTTSFAQIWLENIRKHATPAPQKVVIIGAASDLPEFDLAAYGHFRVQGVRCEGDLGHLHDKQAGRKSHALVGWTAGMLAAAMLAYNEECDFIYQEQDCLAFGDYIGQLYADLGSYDAAFGRGLKPPHQKLKSTQSLFIVKHAHIWSFVRDYLNEGPDLNTDASQEGCYGEVKFWRMLCKHTTKYCFQSAGWNFDRDRPLPFRPLPHACPMTTWAAQQWTLPELQEARQLGLIDFIEQADLPLVV